MVTMSNGGKGSLPVQAHSVRVRNSWKSTIMRDPRIDEILERIGETDSKGKPNKVADMAR